MMENLFEFLLKSSGILAIFYAVYLLFLEGETLFRENRRFLLFGVLCAFIGPFISIPIYVEIEPTTTLQLSSSTLSEKGPAADPGIDFWQIASLIYWTGLAFWVVKFSLQLGSLRSTLKHAVKRRVEGNIRYLETDRQVAPFSFFNYIVYNPAAFDKTELEAILAHEKAHCRQNHSIDILISHLMTMILWINPISFLYRRMIKQNLEFLADASATDALTSKKSYQYTMLKVSGQQIPIAIINHFYNSLIKKRIVMLQKSNSKKANALKTALVLPALALFLFSFNTKEIYVPTSTTSDQSWLALNIPRKIETKITKDTSDEELEKIKKDLAKDGVDFSYTVVRNDKREIIDLSVDIRSMSETNSKMSGASTFENAGEPIKPITIAIDPEDHFIFIGGENAFQTQIKSELENIRQKKMVVYQEDNGELSEEMKEKFRKEGVEIITIVEDIEEEIDQEVDSDKVLKIKVGKVVDSENEISIEKSVEKNGEVEVSEKRISRKSGKDGMEWKEKEGKVIKHIEVIKTNGEKEGNVFILENSDDKEIEVVEGGSFFFIDSDSGEKPLYIIDGKEVKEKAIKAISPKDIETVNVYKGEKAIEKYGKKAKDGVVEITTKKE